MWTFSKGLCILRSVTRIMVKTFFAAVTGTCIFGDCSNVYKRLQSLIWRYFYCAFLGFYLGIDSNVRPGVRKFGFILYLSGMICPWAGNVIANFWKKSNPHPMPCPTSPPPPHRHYIDRCRAFTYDLPGMALTISFYITRAKQKTGY